MRNRKEYDRDLVREIDLDDNRKKKPKRDYDDGWDLRAARPERRKSKGKGKGKTTK